MSVRVLLVDEHPLILRGIRDGLRNISDIEVVGAAGDGQTALQLIAERQPDVVLMGCCLPDIPGSEVARRIEEQGLPTRVLAFSAYTERYYLYQMWEAGAAGYLLQTEPLETVAAAVRVVARGQQRWTAKQIARILYWQTEVLRPWESLTEREREVVCLLTRALSNAEIAETLSITVRTVEMHLTHVLEKLDVHSRLEAVVWVRDNLPEDLWKPTG